ncbi:MAG TPA: hypothetical protein VJ302_00500 [Blastocatellia bacterium]|nr:hypothetical protein [Blastocatellia bacterium]
MFLLHLCPICRNVYHFGSGKIFLRGRKASDDQVKVPPFIAHENVIISRQIAVPFSTSIRGSYLSSDYGIFTFQVIPIKFEKSSVASAQTSGDESAATAV